MVGQIFLDVGATARNIKRTTNNVAELKPVSAAELIG